MIDREELIGYITNNHPCENMCTDGGTCRECAEKLLKEYEDKILVREYNQALEDLFNKCNEKYPKNYANEPELGGRSCVFSLNDIKAFKNELVR